MPVYKATVLVELTVVTHAEPIAQHIVKKGFEYAGLQGLMVTPLTEPQFEKQELVRREEAGE